MKRLARAAILTELRDKLEERGSWCGETHIQKATFLLQEAAGVPLGLDFVLYKHGPFSFDLRNELTELRSDELIRLEPQAYPYGPRLKATPLSTGLKAKFPKTLAANAAMIEKVADFVGSRGVASLERIVTAVMLRLESPSDTPEDVGGALHGVKPHIGEVDAVSAVREADGFLVSLGVRDE